MTMPGGRGDDGGGCRPEAARGKGGEGGGIPPIVFCFVFYSVLCFLFFFKTKRGFGLHGLPGMTNPMLFLNNTSFRHFRGRMTRLGGGGDDG